MEIPNQIGLKNEKLVILLFNFWILTSGSISVGESTPQAIDVRPLTDFLI